MPTKKAVTPPTTTAREGEILAAEAAERLGLTNQAIGQWTIKPGAPVRKAGGRVYVRWPEFARWREQQLTGKKKTSDSQEKFGERRFAAEARAAEIAMERGELALARELAASVDIAEFGEAIGRILDRLAAGLRALPVRLSHLGAQVEEAAEVETERLIEELHRWDEDVVDESDAPTDPTPPDDGEAAAA